MMASIDGRIVVDRWPDIGDLRREYERTAATYNADAWMCGRISMQPFAGANRRDEDIERERSSARSSRAERSDLVSPSATAAYAVAVDPSGRLLWATNDIDGDHVIAMLSNSVSDEYLAHLREHGVSYIFATPPSDSAEGEVDLDVALEKLAASFGIRTLLLEGGGSINGSMLSAGLIDEVSLLVAPVADGAVNVPTLFDIYAASATGTRASRLKLGDVERCAHDILWLRYRFSGAEATGVREG
jgi:riboflavin biosynthesis pyrimidine reductase